MIVCNNQLTSEQLIELDQLKLHCLAVDPGLPTFYPVLLASKRLVNGNFLYYKESQLIGFLAVYFFSTYTCEVCLIVSPEHRNRDIATQLLKAMHPLALLNEGFKVIFSLSAKTSTDWLAAKGFYYQSNEYHLSRNTRTGLEVHPTVLDIFPAVEKDIPALLTIDSICFKEGLPSSSDHLISLLANTQYTVYAAFLKKKMVGKAHIRWDSGTAYFSDIAILPDFQQQGFGGDLLCYCIQQAFHQRCTSIELDVEAKNQQALGLYLKHGFKVSSSQAYWAIDLNVINNL